jgi:hypothetical protein
MTARMAGAWQPVISPSGYCGQHFNWSYVSPLLRCWLYSCSLSGMRPSLSSHIPRLNEASFSRESLAISAVAAQVLLESSSSNLLSRGGWTVRDGAGLLAH